MARRQRIDTVAGAVTVAAGLREIEPPVTVPLDPKDRAFFETIVREKPASEWTPHDIEVAAHLAQAMADLVVARSRLRETGGPVLASGGKLVNNPFSQAVRDETARIVSLRSTLQIHGRGKNGETRDVLKRREMARTIEDGLAGDDAGLLN